MKPTTYYICDILKWLCDSMSDIGVDAIYAEHRPTGIANQLKHFVVVNLPVDFHNEGSYQWTTARFQIVVRDRDGGIAAVDELQRIVDSILGKFPMLSERYSATSPKIVLKGSDEMGFTIWYIQAYLRINTTDRLENVSKQSEASSLV